MPPRLKLQSRDTAQADVPREKEAFAPDPAPADSSAEPASSSSAGKNRKILVVDDNPIVVKAFELKLKESGFTVITATDAAVVGSIVQDEAPELILLDVNFPAAGAVQWNGITVMQWLQRFVQGPPTPIIIITGDDPSAHSKKFMDAGAVAIFQKPLKYPELLETILRILN
jgi:two-component system, OmpR family, response regulator PrrA